MRIEVQGETLYLLPERALFWEKRSILALSDVHIGKAESFQAAGVPLPSGSHHEDLGKLRKLVDRTGARRIFILGDLIHRHDSWTAQIKNDLGLFFEDQPKTEWTLLIGNHEKGSLPALSRLAINIEHKDLIEGPFRFAHGHSEREAEGESDSYSIEGHIHPVVNLRRGSLRMRLPCFAVEAKRLILPSFGVLTGGYEMGRSPGRRLYAAAPHEVFEVPA